MLSLRVLPILMLLSPTPVFAGCHRERINFYFAGDPTLSTSASVDSGSDCTWHFWNGRSGGIASLTIVSAPRHGSANASGDSPVYFVTYKAAGGYRGPDQFSYAAKGGDTHGSGTVTVVVKLDIH